VNRKTLNNLLNIKMMQFVSVVEIKLSKNASQRFYFRHSALFSRRKTLTTIIEQERERFCFQVGVVEVIFASFASFHK
jgi:hypothetical protein